MSDLSMSCVHQLTLFDVFFCGDGGYFSRVLSNFVATGCHPSSSRVLVGEKKNVVVPVVVVF